MKFSSKVLAGFLFGINNLQQNRFGLYLVTSLIKPHIATVSCKDDRKLLVAPYFNCNKKVCDQIATTMLVDCKSLTVNLFATHLTITNLPFSVVVN